MPLVNEALRYAIDRIGLTVISWIEPGSSNRAYILPTSLEQRRGPRARGSSPVIRIKALVSGRWHRSGRDPKNDLPVRLTMVKRWIPISEPPREPGFCWLLTSHRVRLLGGYTTDGRWVVLSVHAPPTDASTTCTHYIPFDVSDAAPTAPQC
jgi:hypothetical protein